MITLEKIPEYLLATTVLHNICILNDDLVDINVVPNQHIEHSRLISNRVDDGNSKRQRIMNNLIIRNN